MSEHRIRFRGGWEVFRPGNQPALIPNFQLPRIWSPEESGPIQLTRRFGRPPIDPRTESAWLEFERVPGLRKVDLNGDDLGPIPTDVQNWTVGLEGLLEPRNTLSLELMVVPAGSTIEVEAWGSIALVIRSGREVETAR